MKRAVIGLPRASRNGPATWCVGSDLSVLSGERTYSHQRSWATSAAGASRPGDDARGCAEIEAEVNLLLEKLGGGSDTLAAAATQVQEIGAEGSRHIAGTVKKTSARQGLAATAAEAANVMPGGGLISGLIGSAAGAATAADNRELAARQHVLSEKMRSSMTELQKHAAAILPDAMRLQHLNMLQATKACEGSDR